MKFKHLQQLLFHIHQNDSAPTDIQWPPKGIHLSVYFKAPHFAPLSHKYVTVVVNYEMYDGIPLLAKWLDVIDTSGRGDIDLSLAGCSQITSLKKRKSRHMMMSSLANFEISISSYVRKMLFERYISLFFSYTLMTVDVFHTYGIAKM